MNDILSYLEKEKANILDTLQLLVETETPTDDKKANDILSQKLAKLFPKLTGGKVQVLPQLEYGDFLRCEWGEGDSQILIVCHFDTVWPVGTLAKRPFTIKPDGTIVGPGVYDMKAGIVAGIFALRALRQLGKQLKHKVVMLLTCDEEVGSTRGEAIVREEAAKSVCALILEPPGNMQVGALKTARKGLGTFDLKIQGRPSHAGVEPEKGRSAIVELAEQIRILTALNKPEAGTTVNVGKVAGGTAANVVAAEATAKIDLRAKTVEEAERLEKELLALKPVTPDVLVQYSGRFNRPPMERTEGTAKLFALAKKIATTQLNFNDLAEMSVGGGSDGNFTSLYTPTLDGLGIPGGGGHAEHEFIYADEITRRTALLALFLTEI